MNICYETNEFWKTAQFIKVCMFACLTLIEQFDYLVFNVQVVMHLFSFYVNFLIIHYFLITH